jgi:ubiquinol-cytochrome c reductase cytochrome b subunit
MRLIKDLGEWFDFRLKLGKPIREAMGHPVPRNTASWAYVFGSASLTVMILQFVTGVCLALVYVPSADGAWNSLQTLNKRLDGSSARFTVGVRISWWLS